MCSNKTTDELIMVVWKIKRRDGNDCRVTWQFNGTDSTCDSRVILHEEENKVILSISHFSSSDEGSYTCEVASAEGTDISHFHVKGTGVATVPGDESKGKTQKTTKESAGMSSSNHLEITFSVCGLAVLLTLLVFSLIIIRKLSWSKARGQEQTSESDSSKAEPQEPDEEIQPYSTFIRRENGLYSTIRLNNPKT
ncbi:hypothetical protein AGOR_G00216130 [Albula goreensis]|uniref:Ig-like domain-containing protein n=1 Tax=Albula goreensis TaxID=1534307 RepID=A0A8T3CP68_9TELE|nr:hypothetical protein AGOR_G00216130 [Albula goreensis]